MMALGVFPFILAFGAKWNLVTFVTGYSHEKLQPTVLCFELVAYLSVRHGRKRDQAEQGWVEPEGFDADWV
jgi:hypothetical protein